MVEEVTRKCSDYEACGFKKHGLTKTDCTAVARRTFPPRYGRLMDNVVNIKIV